MVIVWKSVQIVISSDVENNGVDVIELSYVPLQLYLLRCQSRGVLMWLYWETLIVL